MYRTRGLALAILFGAILSVAGCTRANDDVETKTSAVIAPPGWDRYNYFAGQAGFIVDDEATYWISQRDRRSGDLAGGEFERKLVELWRLRHKESFPTLLASAPAEDTALVTPLLSRDLVIFLTGDWNTAVTIRGVPKRGGPLRVIATQPRGTSTTQLAIVDETLVWPERNRIVGLPVTGAGGPRIIAEVGGNDPSIFDLEVRGSTLAVGVARGRYPSAHSVVIFDDLATSPREIALPPEANGRIALGERHIFVAHRPGEDDLRTELFAIPRSGGSPRLIGHVASADIVATEDAVIYRDHAFGLRGHAYRLVKHDLATGKATPLVTASAGLWIGPVYQNALYFEDPVDESHGGTRWRKLPL